MIPTPGPQLDARPTATPHAAARAARAAATTYLSVVVPVWNGSEHLAHTLYALRRFLDGQPYASELVVVDDSSGPDAVRILDAFRRDVGATVLRNERNQGKGRSVARGMLAASGELRVFIDSDLAYPPTDIATIVDTLEQGSDVAIACRVLPRSRYVMSPTFFPYLFTRHVMSRCFNAVVRSLLVPDVLDTQAGLKGFTRRAADIIFPRLTIDRFGFDVECLHIAARHRLPLTQVPVTFRYDDEPSSVNLARDGMTMIADLGRIRLNGWLGRYG